MDCIHIQITLRILTEHIFFEEHICRKLPPHAFTRNHDNPKAARLVPGAVINTFSEVIGKRPEIRVSIAPFYEKHDPPVGTSPEWIEREVTILPDIWVHAKLHTDGSYGVLVMYYQVSAPHCIRIPVMIRLSKLLILGIKIHLFLY